MLDFSPECPAPVLCWVRLRPSEKVGFLILIAVIDLHVFDKLLTVVNEMTWKNRIFF